MAIPEGFRMLSHQSPYFDRTIGPFYVTNRNSKWVVGMWTADRHMRGKGFVAGLVTSTLADYAMGHVICRELWPNPEEMAIKQINLVTINLNVDFIASPPVGAWLEVESNVIKTGRVCFAESLTKLGDRVMMRANASYIVRE